MWYVLFYLICTVRVVHASTFADFEKLFKSIVNGRIPHLRPEQNQQNPTNITVDFRLISLLDINAVAGTVSITGFFRMDWTDATVTWNPDNFGGIQKATFPAAAIWKPPLIILNAAKDYKTFGIEGSYLQILSNGNVFWEPGESITFTCSIDVTYYPFDTQRCQFNLVVWGYDGFEVKLHKKKKEKTENYSDDNGEWELIRMNVTQDPGGLTVLMHFKRRPLFLIISIILPVMFIALLAIFVFVLPQESGERVGFSMTALLSLVVFLTIAQELLPATALPRLSVICVLLTNGMFMSGCITLSVIISSWVYHRSTNKTIPLPIQQMVNFQMFNRNVSPAGNDEEIETNENEKKGNKQTTWQDVAALWDMLSIIFYTIWFLVALLLFIIDINSGE